ncbi:MAG: penicillin-binding protein activator [Holosporaceae bacterium]|nr:penicillin-binding protein activator [Rhodospirillaceae bacterium]
MGNKPAIGSVQAGRQSQRQQAVGRWVRLIILALGLPLLAACSSTSMPGSSWFEGNKPSSSTSRASKSKPSSKNLPPAPPAAKDAAKDSARDSTKDSTGMLSADGSAAVAMLLPLSGKDAGLGLAMQQAAEFALFDGRSRNLQVAFYDAGESPASASQAMARALKDSPKPLVVFGPLYGGSVSAVKEMARAADVPMVSFSNNPAVADSNTFVLGFGPDAMMASIVRYAAAQGIRDFKGVGRSGAYSAKLSELLRAEAAKLGGSVSQIELYGGNGVSLAEAVSKLKPSAAGGRSGVLLFDSGADLQALSRQIQLRADWPAPSFQLLGTQDWALDDLTANPVLRGAWYPAPNIVQRQAFEQRYQGVYGAPPPTLASLAYDAVALASKLAEARPKNGKAIGAILTEPAGYLGLSGLFRLENNGLSQRGYAIVQVASPSPRTLQPSPTSFQESQF